MKRISANRVRAGATRSHSEATIASFRRDPPFAAEYLNAVLEDGDHEELLIALRYMAKAFGGVSAVARKAELNATTLYRTLSPKGNPELRSLTTLLRALGMRLAVYPIRQRQSRNAAAGSAGSRAARPAVLPREGSGRNSARARARRSPPRASRAAA